MCMGLNVALLKDYQSGDPHFYNFSKMSNASPRIKTKIKIFNVRYFNIIYSKNRYPFRGELPKYIMEYLDTAWENK